MSRWLIALSILIALLSSPSAASACSCGPAISFPPSWWLAESDYVAVGRVLEVREDQDSYHTFALFEVHRVWKGEANALEVLVSDLSSCGVWFIPGKEYLVYLDSHDGGGFYAWACRRIQMEPYLEADIAILGPPLVVPTRETSFGMVKARY